MLRHICSLIFKFLLQICKILPPNVILQVLLLMNFMVFFAKMLNYTPANNNDFDKVHT